MRTTYLPQEPIPWKFDDDTEAAKAAERDGIKLVYGMDGISRRFGPLHDLVENIMRGIPGDE